MSDDKQLALSRRQLLGGLGAVGAASAGAGLGTTALFSDEESFNNNQVQAGELNLVVDYTETYNWVSGTQETESGTIGTTSNPGPATKTIDLSDVKPGDSGSLQFTLRVNSNPGYLWLVAPDRNTASGQWPGGTRVYEESEGANPEPESTDPENIGDVDGDGKDDAVELPDAVNVRIGYGSGSIGTEVFSGSLREALKTAGIQDGVHDLTDGVPLDGDLTNTSATPDPFAADTDYGLRLEWSVPQSVGNRIQGDSITFDLGFYAEQARNNSRTTTVASGDDLQAAIDAAAAGDELVLQGGTFGSGLIKVEKPGLTLRNASGATPTIEVSDATTSRNQVAALRIGAKGRNTLVDGLTVRRIADPSAANGDKNTKCVGVRASGTVIRNSTLELSEASGASDDNGSVVFVANDTNGFGTGTNIPFAPVSDVLLQGNTITGDGDIGGDIVCVSVVSLSPVGGVTDVTIDGNTIQDAGTGIFTGEFDVLGYPADPVSNVTITNSNFNNLGTNTDLNSGGSVNP